MTVGHQTLTIDDPAAGGSDPGAWATAIAHTPHLAAQVAAQAERDRAAQAAEIGEEQ